MVLRALSSTVLFVLVSLGISALSPQAAAQTLAVRQVAGGFDFPVQVVSAPGGSRLFVPQQTGQIRIIQDATSGTVLPAPFLDLSGELSLDFFQEDERGLLSLVFPADYATSGFFYVLIATTIANPPDVDGRIEVRRYQVSADPNVANPVSKTVILSVAHPPRVQTGTLEYYHNGGMLAFGPNGKLWLSIGDGAGWFGNDPNNCAQNAASPLGKLLRIDLALLPMSTVVAPFGNPCPILPSQTAVTIWATGLRNPWRLSFDRQTGDLYIGDVGQDATEEIDVVGAADLSGSGPNFGWRAWEGSSTNSAVCPGDALCTNPGAVTPPVYEYGHTVELCAGSVTGGFVYRGSNPMLQGQYLFADFCDGSLRSFVWDGGGGITGSVNDLKSQLDPLGQIQLPVSFGEDANGEVYIVDFGFGAGAGEVFQIPVPEPSASLAGLTALATLGALLKFRSRRRLAEGMERRRRTRPL